MTASFFGKSRSGLGKAHCRGWVWEGPRTAEKSAQTGFCKRFGVHRTMRYLEGDFRLQKAKVPSAVLAEGASSKNAFGQSGQTQA